MSELEEIVGALRAYADRQSVVDGLTGRDSAAAREHLLGDRRADVRFRPTQLTRPMLARLKAGPVLTLLDVSAGGALIQTPSRLIPGALVLLEFMVPGTRRIVLVRSRVTRSHVAALDECVRYRGACSFEERLELAAFLSPAPAPSQGAASAAPVDTLQAVRHLLASASGLDKLAIARLLGEMQRMMHASAPRGALVAHVETWLRTQVPLMALRINSRRDSALHGSDVLSFELAAGGSDRDPAVYLDCHAACVPNDSQARLLEAGASVIRALYSTR